MYAARQGMRACNNTNIRNPIIKDVMRKIPQASPLAEWLCVPSGKRLNVRRFESYSGSRFFGDESRVYVVVAEQAHPLGPA